MADLNAAVPFYGVAQTLENVPNINASLLLHFAGTDYRVNAAWPNYEAALEASKSNIKHMFMQVFSMALITIQHLFDESAAKLAWQRTMVFFNKTLKI